MKLRQLTRRSLGFSVVEVLVALIVISVGLLGIAKMQALAVSSTNTARLRSLAAIEAASLAASMHANRAYWAGSAPASVTVTGMTISDPTLSASANCTTASATAPACSTASTLAAYDVQNWATAVSKLLPNPTSTITCPAAAVPVSCTISMTWAENAVAINNQEAQAAQAAAAANTTAAFQAPSYTLYVEP